ncbi:MAG TPA: N-acetylmuramic acid 6-phosphate etherase [Armatimonadota bacterium]|nr:N-acetylmuramic acid 6-phosphate etherase [Armatimonadota bacterium]
MRRFEELATEGINPEHARLDELPTLELVTAMNQEDRSVADAVAAVLPEVARAVDLVVSALGNGGRLFYVGAGTSGRLGALDAAECPPTFSVSRNVVQAIIAGGPEALLHSVEAVEDSEEGGAEQITLASVSNLDIVCGLSACGSTPFVLGAMRAARERGARTIGIACNRPSEMEPLADVMITPLTGPEILTGSTRLKAGTAQKMILNMLSTAAMVRLGKVYGNLMVDVHPVSKKLADRAQRIIRVATGVSEEEARALFEESGGRPKVAIVMQKRHCTPKRAEELLARNKGFVKAALADQRP